MWHAGCVPFPLRGRTGEPKGSRWGEEVTEGKNQSGGWGGQGKLSEPTAITGYFQLPAERSSTASAAGGGEKLLHEESGGRGDGRQGVSGSCCLAAARRQWDAPLVTAVRLGWAVGGLGGMGEPRLCCWCAPDVSAPSAVPGCRQAPHPVPAPRRCLAARPPPRSLAASSGGCLCCRVGRERRTPPRSTSQAGDRQESSLRRPCGGKGCGRRCNLGVRHWSVQRAQSPGKTSQQTSKAIP